MEVVWKQRSRWCGKVDGHVILPDFKVVTFAEKDEQPRHLDLQGRLSREIASAWRSCCITSRAATYCAVVGGPIPKSLSPSRISTLTTDEGLGICLPINSISWPSRATKCVYDVEVKFVRPKIKVLNATSKSNIWRKQLSDRSDWVKWILQEWSLSRQNASVSTRALDRAETH